MTDNYGLILVRFGFVAVKLTNDIRPVTYADFAIRVVSPTKLILTKNRGCRNGQVFSSMDEVFGYIRAFYDMVEHNFSGFPINIDRNNVIINLSNEFETAINNFIKEVEVND